MKYLHTLQPTGKPKCTHPVGSAEVHTLIGSTADHPHLPLIGCTGQIPQEAEWVNKETEIICESKNIPQVEL